MAFNPEIKGYMTFGKSFSRGGAFPLEAYEIWTDYDALVAYAANTDSSKDPSYIGQKVAYIDTENNKVVHYGIEIDGTLKELGATPIGDEKSIVVDETNYTISLKGVDGLVFERDILGEDGEPTGEKEEVKFQPLMTKDGLVWVEPSKTTVEGLATLLSELTTRVKALEDDRVTEQELADAVADLEGKINAVDFVDEDELTGALEPYAKTADVNKTLEDYAKTADVNKTLEDYAKTADVNTELDKKAKQSDLEALQNTVNAFLTGEGTEAALDSLKELIAYIESHDDIDIAGILEDIQGVEGKLVGIDGTVADYVTAAINALSIGDYAKAADLTALADRVAILEAKPFDSYATKVELEAHAETAEATYAKKTEVVANETFEEFKTANSKAIEDAVAAHETAVAGTYATKEELKATDDVAKDAQNRVGVVEGKIDEIISVGGEPNVIEKIKVNGVILEVEKDSEGKSTKTVNIAVPTSITTMDGYSDLDARVTANANGIAALEGQLANTNTNVSNNTTEIGKINTEITTGIKPRIEALEGADTVIEGTLAEHTAAIKTINETTIPALSGQIAGEVTAREEAIKGINDKIGTVEAGKTVVDMINAVAGTIDFTPYAKKDEVAATYATIAALEAVYKVDGENKSGAVVDLVNAEKARAEAAEKKNADDIAAINALLNTVDSEDTITSLKELAIWVEAHDTEVIPVINEHTDAINALKTQMAEVETAVETALPAAIAQALVDAKAYTDKQMVKADGTSIVNNEGTFSVGAVSTDNLVQGNFTLVLNGGDAQVTA